MAEGGEDDSLVIFESEDMDWAVTKPIEDEWHLVHSSELCVIDIPQFYFAVETRTTHSINLPSVSVIIAVDY